MLALLCSAGPALQPHPFIHHICGLCTLPKLLLSKPGLALQTSSVHLPDLQVIYAAQT